MFNDSFTVHKFSGQEVGGVGWWGCHYSFIFKALAASGDQMSFGVRDGASRCIKVSRLVKCYHCVKKALPSNWQSVLGIMPNCARYVQEYSSIVAKTRPPSKTLYRVLPNFQLKANRL